MSIPGGTFFMQSVVESPARAGVDKKTPVLYTTIKRTAGGMRDAMPKVRRCAAAWRRLLPTVRYEVYRAPGAQARKALPRLRAGRTGRSGSLPGLWRRACSGCADKAKAAPDEKSAYGAVCHAYRGTVCDRRGCGGIFDLVFPFLGNL